MKKRPTLTPSLIKITISEAFSSQRLYQIECAPKNYVISAQRGDFFGIETNWSIDRNKEFYETYVKRDRIDKFLQFISDESLNFCPDVSPRIRDGGFARIEIVNNENSRIYTQRLAGSESWADLGVITSEVISTVTSIMKQDLGVDLESYFKGRGEN